MSATSTSSEDALGVPPAAVLDPVALGRLRELDPKGTAGIVARVLSAFDNSLQRLGPQFAAACQAADHETMRQVAHTLKSSSASVGAMDLSGACREVENAVREGRLQDLPAAAAALQRELPRALAAVQRELGAGAVA